MLPQPAASNTPSRRQQSHDNAQNRVGNRPANNGNQPAWIASTPELLTEAMTTPEPMSATSTSSSFANPELPSLAWSQQFNNPNNLPDLMPIMFPSDDPFAYPTQPMSTLEDGHFRDDQLGRHSQFATPQQAGSMSQSTPSGSSTTNAPTPTYDAYANLPHYNAGAPSGVKSSVPNRLQTNAHSMTPSRLHSPIPQGRAPSETLSSPDLVSIPNQNFVWQGYNFQPTTMGPDSTAIPQEPLIPHGLPDFNMGMDESAMGMNMDLGISFDDLFGNDAAYRPNHGAPNDDWNQWMNTGA